MEKLHLFDCNCMLGHHKLSKGVSFDVVDSLLASMQKYEIENALVFHSHAKYEHPLSGNQKLAGLISGVQSVYPCWVLLPNHTNEFYNPDVLKTVLSKNHVCAVRMFPSLHRFSLSSWCCGDLYNVLQEIRMPLFLDFCFNQWMDNTPWDTIYEICRSYPELPVILVRQGMADNRSLFALMSKVPNLLFEISYYTAHMGLEQICSNFGATRVLFGTSSPINAPASPISMLYYSNISQAEKQQIASGNLKTLLGRIHRID